MVLTPYGMLIIAVLCVAFLAPLVFVRRRAEESGLEQLPVVALSLLSPIVPLRRYAGGMGKFPVVTLCLLLATIACYFASLSGGQPSLAVVKQWGMTPSEVSLLTLVTHLFLHGSWYHLFTNMLGLWIFGPHVEEALGRWEYLTFYLACGIAGGLLHMVLAMTVLTGVAGTPLVGASGAIFGLLGLFAVRYWRDKARVFLLFVVPAVWAVGGFVVLELLAGISALYVGPLGKVANWAHIGGFAFGALMALPLRMREDSHREYGREDAEKAVESGQNEVAAAHYRQLLKDHPDDAETHHALANVYVALRQGEAAHRHLRDALNLFLAANQYVAVARVYEDALHGFETFPLSAKLLQRIATACEETEHFTLAVHALSELCREYPNAVEAEVGLLRLGKLHLHHLGQPRNAEGIFGEFLRLYPESEWRPHALRLRDEARRTSDGAALPVSGV
jgi:membrane associated rhomboid family serine protease